MNTTQLHKKLLGLQENMMNFALTLTTNREDAQDLTQDTTLKVLNNQEKFIDNINFKGWVLTIMRNIFINNYHRLVRTQTIIDQGVDLYNVDVVNGSAFETPENSCSMIEISKVIDNLSEDLRVPFSMYVSGFKYNEIADRLGIPLGTVKSRIYFARQALQKDLKDFR